MKAYDASGNEVEVPEQEFAQKWASGAIGLPSGTPVPVRLASGAIATVPVGPSLTQALTQKAQIISPEEHAKAVQLAHYSDVTHQMANAGLSTAEGMTQGLSNVAIRALGGPKAAAYVKGVQEAGPGLHAAANIAGMVGAAALTGGESAAAEGVGELGAAKVAATAAEAAPEALGAVRTAETAAEAPGLLRQATNVLGAPTRLLGRVGDAVEQGVGQLLPWEAKSLAGRLTQAAIKTGARGAVEGGLMGAGDYVSEEALDPNPQLSGERLLASVGHGALLGGIGGGVLGAGGELGSEILGRIAPRLQGLAGEQAFRAVSTGKRGVRLAMDIPGLAEEAGAEEMADKLGGIKSVGQEAIDKGVVSAGNNVEDIAQKSTGAKAAAGELVDQDRIKLDERGVEGPRVKNVLESWDKEVMPRLEALPSLNRGALDRVAALREDILRAAVPDLDAKMADAVSVATQLGQDGRAAAERVKANALEDATLSYQKSAELRKRLSDQINDTAPGLGQKPGIVNTAFKDMRRTFEDELEKAGDKGARQIGDPDWLKDYQAHKLSYRKLALYDALAQDSLSRKVANRSLSLTDYVAGGAGAIAGALTGHGLLGLASSVAHKVVRERGNATAAAIMDKVAALGAVRNAIGRVERETARGVERAVGNESRVAPRLKAHVFGTYAEKREAVEDSAKNADAHTSSIQASTGPFDQHSPKVAQAFHLAAIRATMYLASQLPQPKDPTLAAMMPKLAAKWEPTSTERAAFERKFNAVHDPVSVLHGVGIGSVTQDEIAAVAATHPEWLKDTRDQLRSKLLDLDHPLPYAQRIALSKFLGEPCDPTMRPDFIAAIQKSHQSRPQPQTAPKPNSASKGTPKAKDLSFAKSATLSIGGSREST